MVLVAGSVDRWVHRSIGESAPEEGTSEQRVSDKGCEVKTVLGMGESGVHPSAGGCGGPVGFSRLCPAGPEPATGFNLIRCAL